MVLSGTEPGNSLDFVAESFQLITVKTSDVCFVYVPISFWGALIIEAPIRISEDLAIDRSANSTMNGLVNYTFKHHTCS